MKKIIIENIKKYKKYIISAILALIIVFIGFYLYLLWTSSVVATRILDTGGYLEQMWLTNKRVYFRDVNSSGYLYNPKFFDKVSIVELIGCSQIVIYDGKKAFVYHWDSSTRTPEVRRYLKQYLESFKGAKKLEVVFSESERTKKHQKVNFDEILKDIYEITPNVHCDKFVFSLPPKAKSFGIIYRYEIIFAFGKMFSCNKRLKLDRLYKDKVEFIYAGMGYWKKYYYYWKPVKEALNLRRKLYTKDSERNSLYEYSSYWDLEDNIKYDLPTTFEFSLSKFLYGVDNNKLNYYKFSVNEKNQRLEYNRLSEKEILGISSYPILKIDDTKKRTVVVSKSFLNKRHVLMYCLKDDIEFRIKSKTINMRPLLLAGVMELKTFGRAHIKYENGLEITFWVVPEFLYKLLKKMDNGHNSGIEFIQINY